MAENVIFQKLTIKDDVELKIHKDALDFVFQNDDIKNVALSGPYGAGKSSILGTYKKQSDKKFLHVSLAHLRSITNETSECSGDDINCLEGKILNQIIHQIKPEMVPQSSFKIKESYGNKKISDVAYSIIAFLIGVLYLFFSYKWEGFVSLFKKSFWYGSDIYKVKRD